MSSCSTSNHLFPPAFRLQFPRAFLFDDRSDFTPTAFSADDCSLRGKRGTFPGGWGASRTVSIILLNNLLVLPLPFPQSHPSKVENYSRLMNDSWPAKSAVLRFLVEEGFPAAGSAGPARASRKLCALRGWQKSKVPEGCRGAGQVHTSNWRCWWQFIF